MTGTSDGESTARSLVELHGRTYAEQAGVRVSDGPAALFQVLVVATLLAARIKADIAVGAAAELFSSGYRTPRAMLEATWPRRVEALDRARYRRYDERTAALLGDSAAVVLDRWRGDLRRLRTEADLTRQPTPAKAAKAASTLLQQLPGIGPTGAAIFCREVQGVWPELSPYVDRLAVRGADRLGLPTDADRLAAYVDHTADVPHLIAGCVRAALSVDVAREVLAHAGTSAGAGSAAGRRHGR